MPSKLSIKDLPICNKRVLIRVDFNVPLDDNECITDDTRIVKALPTIQHVLQQGGIPIIMSHLGRPKGQVNEKLSLAPCSTRLSELLKQEVTLAPNCVGPEVKNLVDSLGKGDILLLENLRFNPAEEKPSLDPSFAKQLASFGNLFINDAFGTAHRAHSSTTEICKYFPQLSASGLLLEQELLFLGQALLKPQHPFYAIIGGAKVSSKIGVIESLLTKVDGLVVVGGMAFTFLKAQGFSIGNSLCEEKFLDTATRLLNVCSEKRLPLILPEDFVTARECKQNIETSIISLDNGIPIGHMGLDIGPSTTEKISSFLKKAKTVFWNGPAGVFELPEFAKGTNALAKVLAASEATSIVGGGDSVSAIKKLSLETHISHISTGGGASLEYIEFGTLPGIQALSEKEPHSSLK